MQAGHPSQGFAGINRLRKFLFLFFLWPSLLLAQVDSILLRPLSDDSVGNWRTDTTNFTTTPPHCGSSNLYFRIKEAGSGNGDTSFIEVDNDVGCDDFLSCCNTGTTGNSYNTYRANFDNYSSQIGYTPDSFAFYVRSYGAGLGESLLVYWTFKGQESPSLCGTTRMGKSGVTASYTLTRFSAAPADPCLHVTPDIYNDLQIRLLGYLKTAAAADIHVTQVWAVVYWHKNAKGGEQAAKPPSPGRGDTLYPMAAGFATALTSSCGANWQCVDESPGITGCSAGTDSNYAVSDNGYISDYYKLGTHDTTDSPINRRWGQRNVTGAGSIQVDCLAMTVCVDRGAGTGTNTFFCRFGLRDSAGNEWISPEFSTINTGKLTYSWIFPNKTFNGISRWDSISLLGLEAKIMLKGTGTIQNNFAATINNLYVVVYTSVRSTAIADSTNSDMQKFVFRGGSAGFLWSRQSGCVQSTDSTRKIWFGFQKLTVADSPWCAIATRDSGNTWGYLSTGDTVHSEFKSGLEHSGGSFTSSVGMAPQLWADYNTSKKDTFYIVGRKIATTAVLDSSIIRRVNHPANQRADIQGTRLFDAFQSGAVFLPAIYVKGQTIWLVYGRATDSSALVWTKSTDGGATWSSPPDTIPKNGIYTAKIRTTSGNRHLAMVRWTGGFPALFASGWTGDATATMFYQWHDNAANNREAWIKSSGGSADSVRIVLGPAGQNVNLEEMAATSIFRGGTANTDTIAHAVVQRGSRLIHVKIDASETLVQDTVIEESQQSTTNWAQLSMCAIDSFVYLFFPFSQIVNSSSDTSWIMWTMLEPSKSYFRGSRYLSFIRDANHAECVHPTTAVYQKGAYVFGVFADTTRLLTNYRVMDFNRIIRPTAAAAGGTMPLRRRRIILERNKPMGVEDEKDSTGNGFVFEPIPAEDK